MQGDCRAHHEVIYLNDNEMAVLKADSFRTTTIDDIDVSPVIIELENKLEEYELGGLRALHAQGDLRAADGGAQMPARAGSSRRKGGSSLGGADRSSRELVRAHRNHLDRLRGPPGMRHWWAITCWRISPRWSTEAHMPRNSAIAIRSWKRGRC